VISLTNITAIAVFFMVLKVKILYICDYKRNQSLKKVQQIFRVSFLLQIRQAMDNVQPNHNAGNPGNFTVFKFGAKLMCSPGQPVFMCIFVHV
jgi:hypothetical protein